MQSGRKSFTLFTVASITLLSLAGCAATPSTESNQQINSPVAPTTANSGQQNASSGSGNGFGTIESGSGAANVTASDEMSSTSPNVTSSGVSAGVVTTPTNAASTASPASPFPAIVRMAMNQLPSDVKRWAYAPTIYPLPATGPDVEFYQTMVDHSAPMPSPGEAVVYNVTLNDRHGHMLAQFIGSKFDTSGQAHAAILGQFGDVFGVSGTSSPVNLPTGLSGHIVTDQTNDASHVLWSEGRWKIDVSGISTTQPQMAAANQVVQYLHTHFLPAPNRLGEISVEVDSGKPTVMLIWQENNEVFQVKTTSYTKQPIDTAAALAIAMRAYQ